MKANFIQIQTIIKDNPQKAFIEKGRKIAKELQLHVEGVGMDGAIKHCDHFASPEVYKVQKDGAISNMDVFGRLLQQEEMVFMARGGSRNFKLPGAKEVQMNALLTNVEYGMNLREWVKTFALQAFRVDPMGVIFMEVDPADAIDAAGDMKSPRAYPTYKGINSIYDYKTNGRFLEYICFRLTVRQALSFGIIDEKMKNLSMDSDSNYFRFVDDEKDVIFELIDGKTVALVGPDKITQKNPIKNSWKQTPAFIVSNIINYKDPQCFQSPLNLVVELADCYLQDRSIRNLQKKYHGFAKAIEPLLMCPTCMGTKYVNGEDCPACKPSPGQPSTGFKVKTKIGDVARFPLSVLESGSFDFRKIFGYASPDILSWKQQNADIDDLEQLLELTYWGTVRMKRPTAGDSGASSQPITATENDSNEAPKIARLNQTADWAEKTESLVANYIGQYWFPDDYKVTDPISYGRDYILKTADELMVIYQSLIKGGAPIFSMDEAMQRYYQAKYATNRNQMEKYLKMLKVEPFPHRDVAAVEKSSIIPFADRLAKVYFMEWANTLQENDWLTKDQQTLRDALALYIGTKGITEPAPAPAPAAHAFN